MTRKIEVLGIDAGGTMTDTFIVSDKGEYIVGKAQTTPEDESVGLMRSTIDALQQWDMKIEEGLPQLVSVVYSGTTMLNRLLERKGKRIGLIVSAGMEDYLRLERGRQTWLGYSYSDRLHVATHRHNPPLVPSDRIRGVRGRIDVFGDEVFPLFRQETINAVNDLLDKNVEVICVNLLFSYRNPKHELAVREIALDEMKERGIQIPVALSSEMYPVRGDFPRLNTLLVEAYAAEPSRVQLHMIRDKLREKGARCNVRMMSSHGGTIGIEARELAKTLISGPIGGVIGAKYISEKLGTDNIVCADIGGTSFDLALLTAREYDVRTSPDLARFLLRLPTVRIDSIGAGCGSYVRVNPNSNRIEIGPDSAGARTGVCYEAGGVTTTTITDCSVVLGRINPDYFLGGEIKIDRERALKAVKEQIADPLGLDVYEAAAGAVEILEDTLRNQVEATVTGKGFLPADYTLLCYGGGGPLHVAGYSEDIHFEDILIPTWAAGFSAFGCACADFEYRYDHTIDLKYNPADRDDEKLRVSGEVNNIWSELKKQVSGEFKKSGIDEEKIKYSGYLRMQYMGQLEDLEIATPVTEITKTTDWDEIVGRFEELYSRMYSRSARSPELGYSLTTAIITGTIEVEKPQLVSEELKSETPPERAFKGTREVFHGGKWYEAQTYEMEHLEAGNRISGLSIIESPSTTFVILPGRTAWLDERRIFHLSNSV